MGWWGSKKQKPLPPFSEFPLRPTVAAAPVVKLSRKVTINKKTIELKDLNLDGQEIVELLTTSQHHHNTLVSISAVKWSIKEISSDFFTSTSQFLEYLNLKNNMLTEFPQIFEWVNLETLILSNNVIKEVPDDFKSLAALKHFEISHNYLTKFPEILVNVYWVDLSYNLIEEIPSGIFSKSHAIQLLNLSHNLKISTYPEDMLTSSNIYKVNLNSTLIKCKDLDLKESYRAYLRRRRNKVDKDPLWDDQGDFDKMWILK